MNQCATTNPTEPLSPSPEIRYLLRNWHHVTCTGFAGAACTCLEMREKLIAELAQREDDARREGYEECRKEAADICDTFTEAYYFYKPYPKGYVYKPSETRAAMHFAEGRFKVAAEKIRALTGDPDD